MGSNKASQSMNMETRHGKRDKKKMHKKTEVENEKIDLGLLRSRTERRSVHLRKSTRAE